MSESMLAMGMVVIGAIVLVLVAVFLMYSAFYIKVPQGTALIVNDLSAKPKVHFTGAMVYPIIYKKEYMRISLITLEIDRRGVDGLICKDNIRADISVAFYLRVNETVEDVLKVAKNIGVQRASDRDAVYSLFSAKFSEALKTVGKQIEFVSLFEDRITFRESIVEVIGSDLNGYVLEDVAIDYLEQTPKDRLNPDNIMDAEGIRKITELTASQNIVTNEIERDEELAIKKKNVEAKEAMLSLEKQQADAEARQEREVANIQARERAEMDKVAEEERLKAEAARIATQQEIDVQEENKQREVEIAEQNRLRAVVIERERVTRARELEVVARERQVELDEIAKEKAIEEQKKDIQHVIRERVAVERTVAEQEEAIKEVREVSEADRQKQVEVLDAQAKAEQALVMQVKQAEADEKKAQFRAIEINTIAQAELEAGTKEAQRALVVQVKDAEAEELRAQHKANEINTLAQAELEAATKEAEAKKRLAEGQEAEMAAPGMAEAKVLEERLTSQARGEESLGVALARADAEKGRVEAEVILQRFKAEAEGLVDKFSAMNTMSNDARAHEEFRMALEKHLEEAVAQFETQKIIAREQAELIGTAYKNANIEIVGGDGEFFQTFSKGLSMGKAVDGMMDKSPALKAMLENVVDRVVGPNTVE